MPLFYANFPLVKCEFNANLRIFANFSCNFRRNLMVSFVCEFVFALYFFSFTFSSDWLVLVLKHHTKRRRMHNWTATVKNWIYSASRLLRCVSVCVSSVRTLNTATQYTSEWSVGCNFTPIFVMSVYVFMRRWRSPTLTTQYVKQRSASFSIFLSFWWFRLNNCFVYFSLWYFVNYRSLTAKALK